MLTRIVLLFASRPRRTLALWATALTVGAVVYVEVIPRDGFPSVDVPIAVVSGDYFVDDRDRVDEEITLPISVAVSEIELTESVQTFARANSFSVIAEFRSSTSSQEGVDLLATAIDDLDLPGEAVIEYQAVDAARFFNEFDLLVAVSGPPGTPAEALEQAAERVGRRLVDNDAVERVETLPLLTTATDPATGETQTRLTSFNQITSGTGDSTTIRPAVSIGVVGADGSDALAITDGVRAELAGLDDLDDGFQARVAVDFGTQIRSQIASLQRNVLTGVLAVALVSFLLISWRASLITAAFIVTVMAVMMIVLHLSGISLNTISLFGLILTLGLFVDDAVVIVEAIDQFREPDDDPLTTVETAIRRVGAASVSGTVTTVLVFAPMLFISGVLGRFIRQLPVTVMAALTVSLALSLLLIPTGARLMILRRERSSGPLTGIESRLARGIASLPAVHRRARGAGRLIRVGGFALSILMLLAGVRMASNVGFDIFPPQKDGNDIEIDIDFDPGLTIDEAADVARVVNERVAAELGDNMRFGYLYLGGSRSAIAQYELIDFRDRSVTSPEIEAHLDLALADLDGARVRARTLNQGPPESEFPFQVQIFGDDATSLAELAGDMVDEFDGMMLERPNGSTFTVVEATVALDDVVARVDGERLVEFRARFDADDATTLLDVTQDAVQQRFGAEELVARGLQADALGFDFGQESENSESFASTQMAFLAALVLMFVLLAVQFRSLLQPLLVFLAIPFSFFGVIGGLWLTDNPISFFVMLGLIGLIGIAVNNTILLTDFANQERRAGADRVTAIETALRRRFRPLVATTLTTVAGLLPLAMTDPFWESLAFTIIFGLVSSTVLVVLSFPYYYLALEWLRDGGRRAWAQMRSSTRSTKSRSTVEIPASE